MKAFPEKFSNQINQIVLDDIQIDIIQKKIKNIHLTVYPPDGRVRISVPIKMNQARIYAFAVSRLGWIKKHRSKILKFRIEIPKEFQRKETQYFNGKLYFLKIIDAKTIQDVILTEDSIEIHVPIRVSQKKVKTVLDEWFRSELKNKIPGLIEKWEPRIERTVSYIGIKKMKTRWGTCNPSSKRIWLNLELAKKSPKCLEYVFVHEMVHLLEKKHNKRFFSFMTEFLPDWKDRKKLLNS